MKARKIIIIVVWCLALAGTLTILGFANKEMDNAPCAAININVNGDGENHFIEQEDVLQMLKEKNKKLVGQPIDRKSVV